MRSLKGLFLNGRAYQNHPIKNRQADINLGFVCGQAFLSII